MSEEKRKILEMLSEGKITLDEAQRLLSALDVPDQPSGRGAGKFRYLRVVVEPGPGSENGDRVNIRVPFKLMRAGLKLAALIPQHAQLKLTQALKEKGMDIDFSRITADDLEELLLNLNDLTVEVDGTESVRVFCE